jgi:membrane protease YdiL (CAAX protease family)
MGPLFEELIFRGSLQGILNVWMGRAGSAVLIAFFFVLLHGFAGPSWNQVPVFFGAAAMGFLRWKTDSLYVCIIIHMAGNTFLLAVNHLLVLSV